MNKQNIDSQIQSTFSTAKKTENENGDIYYQIDDKTKIYLFTESNNRFKIGIILGFQSTHVIGYHKQDGEFYVDFQFQNDSLIIDDKFPCSSKSSAKVDLNSLKEIVFFLKEKWDDYNNHSKN